VDFCFNIAVLSYRSVDTVRTTHFTDAMRSEWPDETLVDNLDDFMSPYVKEKGVPLLTVNFQNGLVTISRV
jgi:hypothetical protein